ncbi:MAG: Spi family protease inhibitor [Paludibacteraceae bacterium]|nr:Spi family protease inhibitor [Paludibacteraceae bacterium]
MKSRISLLGLMAIVFACTMNAAPISIQRAAEIANVFLSPSIAPTAPNRAPVRPRLMHTATPQAAYYIFENENGGFIIVAGDDVAYPVLGYSNQGSLAANEMPDNTKAWLDLYAAEIENAVDSGATQSAAVRQAWDNIAAYANASVTKQSKHGTKMVVPKSPLPQSSNSPMD